MVSFWRYAVQITTLTIWNRGIDKRWRSSRIGAYVCVASRSKSHHSAVFKSYEHLSSATRCRQEISISRFSAFFALTLAFHFLRSFKLRLQFCKTKISSIWLNFTARKQMCSCKNLSIFLGISLRISANITFLIFRWEWCWDRNALVICLCESAEHFQNFQQQST